MWLVFCSIVSAFCQTLGNMGLLELLLFCASKLSYFPLQSRIWEEWSVVDASSGYFMGVSALKPDKAWDVQTAAVVYAPGTKGDWNASRTPSGNLRTLWTAYFLANVKLTVKLRASWEKMGNKCEIVLLSAFNTKPKKWPRIQLRKPVKPVLVWFGLVIWWFMYKRLL